jgi:hypothetical protein
MALHNTVIPAYTWATKPAIANWTAHKPILLTDLGPGGSIWWHNGVNWAVQGGSYVHRWGVGSKAAPHVSLTGVVTSLFTMPGGAITIPAGLLVPGRSRIIVSVQLRKSGAAGTTTFWVYLGTTGTYASDSALGRFSSIVASGASIWYEAETRIFSSTGHVNVYGAPVNTLLGDSYLDQTASVNTAALMYLSFGISGANAADTMQILGYEVVIHP